MSQVLALKQLHGLNNPIKLKIWNWRIAFHYKKNCNYKENCLSLKLPNNKKNKRTRINWVTVQAQHNTSYVKRTISTLCTIFRLHIIVFSTDELFGFPIDVELGVPMSAPVLIARPYLLQLPRLSLSLSLSQLNPSLLDAKEWEQGSFSGHLWDDHLLYWLRELVCICL